MICPNLLAPYSWRRSRELLGLLAVLLAVICPAMRRAAHAQASLRESLERLDRDQDGRIDPEEITPRARPYLERIAESRRLSLERSNDIESLQEAARVYHAIRNGVADQRVEIQMDTSLKEFGADKDAVLIPDFGLADLKYPYNQEDVDEARRTMRRYDRNRDGFIDRQEAADSSWTHSDPFESDLNKDGRISSMEFTQRYARRRLLANASGELIQKAQRVGGMGIERANSKREDDDRGDSSWWRRGGSNSWLAASMLGRFDADRNGRLELKETTTLGLPVGRIDIDRDGQLSRSELQAYLTELQEEATAEIEGIPGWFYELDADRDGQVAMSEFTEEWTEAKFLEFERLDANQDGLLTARELASSRAIMGGSYTCSQAQVLAPGKTVISEIDIDEDFFIADVDLQLSITHTSTGLLDGYLLGPDGQRIELFSEVGGSGDHFDDTVFDDQAEVPIVKAQSPFSGRFQTQGQIKRQPSLSHFVGSNARGVWQLIVRGTRNDRFGMLHEWSLIFKTQEGLLSSSPDQASDAAAASPLEKATE